MLLFLVFNLFIFDSSSTNLPGSAGEMVNQWRKERGSACEPSLACSRYGQLLSGYPMGGDEAGVRLTIVIMMTRQCHLVFQYKVSQCWDVL